MTDNTVLDRFETELLAELQSHALSASRARRATRRRRRLAVGAVAAGVVAVTGSVLLPSGHGPLAPERASAASVLLEASHSAAGAPLHDGTYWRTHTYERWDYGRLKGSLDEQIWQRKDGTMWMQDNGGHLTRMRGAPEWVLCDKSVDYADLQDLPDDPTALRAAIADAMLHGDDGPLPPTGRDSIVTDCTLQLFTLPVSPAVRAAAFRSLAQHDGVTNLGPAVDNRGRRGTELAFVDGAGDRKVIIDEGAGRLLQFDMVGRKGTNTETLVDAVWTDSLPG